MLLILTTEPPTKVQQLQATQSTNTTITIQWNAPANTGGRNDLVYQISYRRIGSEQIITSTTTQNTHQLTGLQPLSEYRITVVSANGITLGLTDVAAITLESRKAEITSNTTEGGMLVKNPWKIRYNYFNLTSLCCLSLRIPPHPVVYQCLVLQHK